MNKKQRRKLRGNLSHLRMKKMQKIHEFCGYTIHLNNNGGIVDINPRDVNLFNRVQGRQFADPLTQEIIENSIL